MSEVVLWNSLRDRISRVENDLAELSDADIGGGEVVFPPDVDPDEYELYRRVALNWLGYERPISPTRFARRYPRGSFRALLADSPERVRHAAECPPSEWRPIRNDPPADPQDRRGRP